jgi:hypothetical protein
VQPYDSRIPQVAETVWHEIRSKQLFEKLHDAALRLTSPNSYRKIVIGKKVIVISKE